MSSVRLIVGLGNPGRDYAETRHNAGFMVLDRLARRWGAEWKQDKAHKGLLAAGPGVLLIKPQTFMNNSGECVGPIMRYYKYAPEQVLCVYDDTDLPMGSLRLRQAGSSGGHNGIKSLIAHLGSEKFPRVRVGVGAAGQKQMIGHVLGKFAPDERPAMDTCLDKAADAVETLLKEGFEAAANKFNTRKQKKPKPTPSPEPPPPTDSTPAPDTPGEPTDRT